jgi:hypothetical protein
LLAIVVWPTRPSPGWQVVVLYFLYELFLNLFHIIFVGKLRVIQPTASVERSLLLFLVNSAQIVLAFAVFYRGALGIGPVEAIVNSLLIFGTDSHPIATEDNHLQA